MANPVNPVTHPKPRSQWLEMNVRRAHTERLHNHGVHQLDDRGVRIDGIPILLHTHFPKRADLHVPLGDVLNQFADAVILGRPVILLEGILNLILIGNTDLHLLVERLAKRVDRIKVGGVGHRHRDAQVVMIQRHHLVLVRHGSGNRGDHVVLNRLLGNLHKLHA